VYEEEREIVMVQPDGYKSPYTTISYANGPGNHFFKPINQPSASLGRALQVPEQSFVLSNELWTFQGPF
jgi:hypothetical protein